jgi:hypothetical protein
MAAMQPFVNWKNSIGISTSIVDVATIGNNSTAIKNHITNLYNSSNLSFVLLVGDASEVSSGSYSGGLSDAYYSTITADKYPDIFVGRFSANNTAHVDTQVERTVAYEQEGHELSMGGWNTWGMGVASNQGAGAGHYGESDDQHIGLIRNELLAYGFTKVDEIYDPTGTKTMVRNGLNEGRRVVNYCGHGSSTSWGSTGFSNTDVNALTNVGKLPFICSVACVNGAFSGTCFAEAWMRATHNDDPTGAIACYMSSVNQSWAPPMYAEGNHSKSGYYGAAERFWMETHECLGTNWYGGSCCMMDLAGSTGQQEFMNWIYFGDPSLCVRTAIPPAISMSFPLGLPNGLCPPGPEHEVMIEIKPGLENYVPGSGYMYYRFDSGAAYTAVPLTELGGDQFSAVIPNTAPGDEPEFYFTAEGDGGTTIFSPPDAPNSVYSFELGFIELVMEEDFEAESGWTVSSQNLQTGEWERADPSGTTAQPEQDHTPAGTKCFVTGASGGSSGDNDVDGGPTQLISPTLDFSSGDAEISFYIWFYHTDYGTQQPLQVHVTNGGAWQKVADVSHGGDWALFTFTLSDHVTPTADVQVRFTANDNPNDDIVEALVDDMMVQRYIYDPALWADGYSIPVSTGAVIDLSMNAGAANAAKPYLLLGSLSGTSPGFPLPGGATLPLNWDYFTDIILLLLNTAVCQNFMGSLDGTGQAVATLNAPGPLDSMLIGETAHFAFTTGSPFDFQSNAIPVTFDP